MGEKYALALCGGGGKGSYHIGVWKALEELGIFQNIEAFSGTSVGALNAVLFAIGDYENAEKIWLSIKESDLLAKSETDLTGLFSRDGLIRIIDSVPLSKLRSSKPVYVNVFCADDFKTHSVHINHLSRDEITKYLLASSAIPIVYPPVEIDGKDYYDGGFIRSGNVPAEVLYKNGYRNIMVSSLDPLFNIDRVRSGSLLSDAGSFFRKLGNGESFTELFKPGKYISIKKAFPDADFTVFKPSEYIGNMVTEVLDFSQTGILRRMIEGYADTHRELTGKDLSYMLNNFNKFHVDGIHSEIKEKMLRIFQSRQELEEFAEAADELRFNIEMPTMGGKIWYKDIADIFGWKLQRHIIIPEHYRLLDQNGVRKAWSMDPEAFLKALDDYEKAHKSKL